MAGGVYHVTSRGNAGQMIYLDDVDRTRFLELLAAAADRHSWRVLAYCEMGNHYHLAILTELANLARGMRDLNGGYAQWHNRRHRRYGHLLQGRYGAKLVQDGLQLRAVLRYMARNPVRAGLVNRAADWEWSSHPAMCGLRPPGLVAVDLVLAEFHELRAPARRAYIELVEGEEGLEIAPHPLLLGDEEFVSRHLELVPPCPEFPRAHVRPKPTSLETLRSVDDVDALVAAHRAGHSMRELAAHLACGVTTVHRRIRAYEEQ